MAESDVPLKTITDKLGPGIYLDFGCSGLVMKIFNPLKNRYKSIDPDNRESIDKFLPFYNIIQEGLETINHYNKLSWNNIVSRKDDADINTTQGKLIDASRKMSTGH